MKKIEYVEPLKFNCQLYILRMLWDGARASTKEAMLYDLRVKKKIFMEVIDGNIRNTRFQYDRINGWIKKIYSIEHGFINT